MKNNKSLLWLCVSIGALLLVSCQQPEKLAITSLTDNPSIVIEGGQVQFLLEYANVTQGETFEDVEVVFGYGPYLEFKEAYPNIKEHNPSESELIWGLGSLDPGSEGQINIQFIVSSEIPDDIYELNSRAEISGFSGTGGDRNFEKLPAVKETTLIQGHLTPTPEPSPTSEAIIPTVDRNPTSGTQPTSTASPVPVPTKPPTATPLPPILTEFARNQSGTSLYIGCIGSIIVAAMVLIDLLRPRRTRK